MKLNMKDKNRNENWCVCTTGVANHFICLVSESSLASISKFGSFVVSNETMSMKKSRTAIFYDCWLWKKVWTLMWYEKYEWNKCLDWLVCIDLHHLPQNMHAHFFFLFFLKLNRFISLCQSAPSSCCFIFKWFYFSSLRKKRGNTVNGEKKRVNSTWEEKRNRRQDRTRQDKKSENSQANEQLKPIS